MRRLWRIGAFFLFISYMAIPFGCKSQPKAQVASPQEIIKTEDSASTLQPKTSATIPDKDYWDTSDVDVSKIDPNRKLIAFTFDDSPASTLESIVGTFLHFNSTHPDAPASATLFCNGMRLRQSTAQSVEIALTAGFELGNHTQNHYDLSKLSPSEIRREIDKTDKLLSLFDGKPLHLLRAPYGNVCESVRAQAKTPIISWFIDTKDWTGIPADSIYQSVWGQKHAGVIVLMHDGYPHTVSALKQLLPDLYDAGYQAVSVSQMAKAHDCRLKIGGVYTRARNLNRR